MVGAAVAVLAHRAAELRDHEDHRLAVCGTEQFREAAEAVAELLEMICELPLYRAFIDVRIPSAQRHEGELDRRVPLDQVRQPVRILTEAVGRGRTIIGLGHVLPQFADQLLARGATLLVSDADRIATIVKPIEGRFDSWIVERQGTRRAAPECNIRDRYAA